MHKIYMPLTYMSTKNIILLYKFVYQEDDKRHGNHPQAAFTG
jgi:hypothetical protein